MPPRRSRFRHLHPPEQNPAYGPVNDVQVKPIVIMTLLGPHLMPIFGEYFALCKFTNNATWDGCKLVQSSTKIKNSDFFVLFICQIEVRTLHK